MPTVLVIEDDRETREIYLECLEAEGYTAISAENGELGIWKACQTSPDLVVCDIMMPQLDGYAVLKALRLRPATADIPFIFLTAKATIGDRHDGMELGANTYLQKPCTVETLLSAIATWLKGQPSDPMQTASLIPHPSSLIPRLKGQPGASTQTASMQTALPVVSQPDSTAAPSQAYHVPNCSQLASVFQFIEAHYDQPISLTEIAQAVGYSPAYLTDLVKRQTGQSVHAWLVARRMLAAQALLLKTDRSVNEIARAVGYASECNFFRQFRQFYQVTPKAWRKQNRL